MRAYRDYALAAAARLSLGDLGFLLVGLGAIAFISSAINATLYGTASVSYVVAKVRLHPQGRRKEALAGRHCQGRAPQGPRRRPASGSREGRSPEEAREALERAMERLGLDRRTHPVDQHVASPREKEE